MYKRGPKPHSRSLSPRIVDKFYFHFNYDFNNEAIIHKKKTIKSVSFIVGSQMERCKIRIPGAPVKPFTAIRYAEKWLSKPMTKILWNKYVRGKDSDAAFFEESEDFYENRGALLGNHTWLDGVHENAEHDLELETGS
jgi:hypothetical protein